MSFEVNDFVDMTRLLILHPEWREELRKLILADSLLTLPDIVRDLATKVDRLADAQERTEKRIEELAEAQARTEKRVEELAEAQARTEKRMDDLTARMDQLTARMDQLTARMDQLAARMDQLTARMDQLTARMDQLAARMDQLAEAQARTERRLDDLTEQLAEVRGITLEWKYRENAGSYLGLKLRKAKVMKLNELEDTLLDKLTEREYEELWPLDLLVRGRIPATGKEVHLAVEISGVIDRGDIHRSMARAKLLQKAGLSSLPVVAGQRMTEGARAEAEREHIPVLSNGHIELWEEALAARGLLDTPSTP